MRRYDDAYGHLIYDFHCGKAPQEIIEREDGLIATSMGPSMYFAEYQNWSQNQQQAIDLAHGRVLDIGCGAGRHALHIQNKGLKVVGIDLSPLAVKTCQERGLKDAQVLSITQINSKLGVFDTILMLGNNFGLFGNLKRAKWLLRKFYSITSDNATIIAESADPYTTMESHHLSYHKLNQKRGRLAGQLKIRVRYLTHIGRWFEYLMVSREEMEMVIDGTGWHINRFIPEKDRIYTAIIKKNK